MKKDWEIKNFEDCINKVTYTNKIQKIDFLKEGEYPIVSQEEGLINGFWDNEEDVFQVKKPIVIFGDHTRILKYVDFDFVLGADGVKIFEPIDELKSKFLLYFLKWFNVPSLGYSRHYKLLKELEIPIPPLSVQQSIVAELDTLHRLKELQEQQLAEYDNLAQSTFYAMFGDPIENEKGWEVKTAKYFCIKITDGTHDTPLRLTEGIKFITGKHIRPFEIDYNNSDYVTKEVHDEIYKRCNPEFGDVLYTNIGVNLGTAALNSVCYEFSMKNVALFKINKKLINGNYLQYYLNNERVRINILEEFASGGAQKFLSLSNINKISVPIPPLTLQTQFAERIEKIEAQKERIKQSIAQTGQLIDYTVDKYFG